MSYPEFVSHFNKLEAFLFAFAVRLTRDETDAQDLVQETAYKAFKYRKLYQPHTNLRAWLITIMRNTFINNYRKKKRRQTLNDRTTNDYFIDSGNRTVVNLGESNVTVEELEQMIDRVEDWARIPFLMYYQGYKYEEIASELDIPLGTVKSRIFFARKKLRSMVGSAYQAHTAHDLIN